MRSQEHARWHRRRGLHLGVAASIAAFTLVVLSPAAFAHANLISGITSCGSPTSASYQVTWTVANDWNLPETARVTAATGGLGTLSVTSLGIAASGNGSGGDGHLPYASVTLVQTLPDSVTGSISVNVASRYSDGYTTSNVGQLSAPTDCAPTVSTVPTTTVPTTTVPPAVINATPVIAAAVSPTTIPATPVAAPPAPTKNKIARSSNSGKRPTLLAGALSPAKPVVPITKAATFTG
jgi:hypothetical protein